MDACVLAGSRAKGGLDLARQTRESGERHLLVAHQVQPDHGPHLFDCRGLAVLAARRGQRRQPRALRVEPQKLPRRDLYPHNAYSAANVHFVLSSCVTPARFKHPIRDVYREFQRTKLVSRGSPERLNSIVQRPNPQSHPLSNWNENIANRVYLFFGRWPRDCERPRLGEALLDTVRQLVGALLRGGRRDRRRADDLQPHGRARDLRFLTGQLFLRYSKGQSPIFGLAFQRVQTRARALERGLPRAFPQDSRRRDRKSPQTPTNHALVPNVESSID